MQVTIEKALEFIYTQTKPKSIKIIPIEEALGSIVAQDVTATYNLPPFDNSAMDGYAVKVADSSKTLQVCHTIFAGDNYTEELHNETAIKIMTGAKIPLGTQCIVPIEDVTVDGDNITLPDNLTLSKHIRLAGEDIKSATQLLSIGQKLDAHQITLLASQGISHIKVYKKPRIALFASGNELKMHFEKVEHYQLYNTNSPTLLSRAQELGCEVEFIGTAKDTLEDIKAHIQSALECDLVITSGGVSVGDADFTKEAFGAFGYDILFDKVEIKPGKPTTFGKIGNTMILNLPGNPLAAALNFELFGRATIYALSGAKEKFINTMQTKMKENYKLKKGRRTLIPGVFNGEDFTPCEHFAPGMISPLAHANGFIILSQECSEVKKGESVKFISTKFSFTSQDFKNLVSC